jgi:PPP family 3-phenylpropionic acid transporter
MAPHPRTHSTHLAVFYVLYFMGVGVSLPFLPAYFSSLGFSPSRAVALLAVGPLCSLLAPPWWGHQADRSGRPGVVLVVVALGTVFGFALLAQARSWPSVFGALVVSSLFSTAITTLIDSLALQHVAASGGSYASLRVWGSIGFVITSMGYGLVVDVIDVRLVWLLLGLALAYGAWAAATLARAPARPAEGPRPSLGAVLALLRRREVALLLVATTLHWIACAPYHGALAIYLKDLGQPPWTVSLSSSVGVTSEVLVLLTWPRFAARLKPRHVLLLSFAVSGLRWAGMALTSSPWVLGALAVLHGLTFGAFFVSAVATMAELAPQSLRATGQAVLVATTFGIGGMVGFLSTGPAYEALGGHRLFAVAGALEVLPVLVVWWAAKGPLPQREPVT